MYELSSKSVKLLLSCKRKNTQRDIDRHHIIEIQGIFVSFFYINKITFLVSVALTFV